MKKLLAILLLISATAQAQGLMSLLGDEAVNSITKATFKDSRIVNAQSNEQAAKGELKFMVQHRFGTLNSGGYNLWGLDNSKIRLGFEYGLHERLAIGFGRSSSKKEFDLSAKGKVLQQSTEMPVSISAYSAIFFQHPSPTVREQSGFDMSDQFSFSNQIILTKKVNRKLSVALLPTHLHLNTEDIGETNDPLFVGFGGRYKLSRRVSVNGEYFYALSQLSDAHTNVLSLGFDIETGGHVFSLHISNSRGMNERAFLVDTTGDWMDGDIYFGFNISRTFSW